MIKALAAKVLIFDRFITLANQKECDDQSGNRIRPPPTIKIVQTESKSTFLKVRSNGRSGYCECNRPASFSRTTQL